MLHRTMPSITTRPCPADARAALEQAGLAPAWARLYAARGVTHPEQVAHPPAAACCRPPACCTSSAPPRCWPTPFATTSACSSSPTTTPTAHRLCGRRARPAPARRAGRFSGANRLEHGYGLTPDIVKLAAARQPDLIVTVDNGIAAVDGVAAANALGIPVLVTDHHLPATRCRCRLHRQSQPAGLRLRVEKSGGGGRDVLCAAGAARRTAPARSLCKPVRTGPARPARPGRARHRRRRGQARRQQPTLVENGLARMRAGKASAGVNALFRAAARDPARATVFDLGFMLARVSTPPAASTTWRSASNACWRRPRHRAAAGAAARHAQPAPGATSNPTCWKKRLAILASFNPTDSHSLTAYQPGGTSRDRHPRLKAERQIPPSHHRAGQQRKW